MCFGAISAFAIACFRYPELRTYGALFDLGSGETYFTRKNNRRLPNDFKYMISVSTIIPVYNGSATIAQAIDSALAQDFEGQEIIVVNDGSTDATSEILRSYGDRIRLIEQPNGGRSRATNVGIFASTGEYIAFLHADDYWLPGRISATVDLLKQTGAGFAFCGHCVIDRNTGITLAVIDSSTPLPTADNFLDIWPPTPLAPTMVTMRADLARECGGFPEHVGWGEDVLLWLTAIKRRPCVFVPQVLAVYRGSANLRERRYSRRDRKPFEREMIARAGRAGRKYVGRARDQYANLLLASSLTDMKNGDKLRGIADFARLLAYRPSYVLRATAEKLNLRKFARL